MTQWNIEFHDAFKMEFDTLSKSVQLELLASLIPLEAMGPQLGRPNADTPNADTLKGSKHANMKELRFSTPDGVWRVAFVFDPRRTAIVLVAGDKTKTSKTRFYKQLIRKADQRFDEHLASLTKGG